MHHWAGSGGGLSQAGVEAGKVLAPPLQQSWAARRSLLLLVGRPQPVWPALLSGMHPTSCLILEMRREACQDPGTGEEGDWTCFAGAGLLVDAWSCAGLEAVVEAPPLAVLPHCLCPFQACTCNAGHEW